MVPKSWASWKCLQSYMKYEHILTGFSVAINSIRAVWVVYAVWNHSKNTHTQTLFSLFSTATDSTLLSATDVPLMISFVCLFSRVFFLLLDISRQNQYGYALSFIFSANVFCMFYILTVVWLNIQLLLKSGLNEMLFSPVPVSWAVQFVSFVVQFPCDHFDWILEWNLSQMLVYDTKIN